MPKLPSTDDAPSSAECISEFDLYPESVCVRNTVPHREHTDSELLEILQSREWPLSIPTHQASYESIRLRSIGLVLFSPLYNRYIIISLHTYSIKKYTRCFTSIKIVCSSFTCMFSCSINACGLSTFALILIVYYWAAHHIPIQVNKL